MIPIFLLTTSNVKRQAERKLKKKVKLDATRAIKRQICVDHFESLRPRRDLNPPKLIPVRPKEKVRRIGKKIVSLSVDATLMIFNRDSYALRKEIQNVEEWRKRNEYKWDEFRIDVISLGTMFTLR